jgi:hypothetical protein
MYYLDKWTTIAGYPMLENWFIAAVPGNPFLVAWLEEFELVLEQFLNDGQKYLEALRKRCGTKASRDIQQGIPNGWGVGYLTQHLSSQKIMQIDHVAPSVALDMAEAGPYAIAESVGWSNRKTALQLVRNPGTVAVLARPSPLIKLNSGQRNALLLALARDCTIDYRSVFARFLLGPHDYDIFPATEAVHPASWLKRVASGVRYRASELWK